jgi:hypothetical protein
VTSTWLPRIALASGIAMLFAALAVAPGRAAQARPAAHRSPATVAKSFRPVAVRGATMIFRVRAVRPESVQRAALVSDGHSYAIRTAVVREALRRRRLIRTRLTAAVAARAHKRAKRRGARLVIYVRRHTSATAPRKSGGTSDKGATGSSPASAAPAAGTSKKTAASLPSFPCGDWGTFAADSLPGACWRPYSDSSPFNRPLPANPRLATDSQQMIDTMTGWGAPEEPYFGEADSTGDWNHPYYFSKPTDPLFTIHCTESWGTCAVEGMQIHIPDAARAAGGSDGHMAVVDQVAGWEYDFWQVKSKPQGGGTITISWGGRTRVGTADADGLGSDATAALFGLMAGIIRYPEMAAGNINHALFLVIKCARGKVYPAQGLGADCSDGHAPAMGQHLYLDMGDDEIAALDAPDWQKTILRAMAHYGMFVGDTGGSPWGVQFESGSTYTSFGQADPWVTWAKQQPGESDWQGRQYLPRIGGVDWDSRLKVVDPCVDQGSC